MSSVFCSSVKPIETVYNGYRFRSRLEARWAVFLDSFGEEWEYEREGYELPSGRYLPDFWLPRLQCWLEIKPTQPTEHEKELCEDLNSEVGDAVIICQGRPSSDIIQKVYRLSSNYACTRNTSSILCRCGVESGSTPGVVWCDDFFWAIDKQQKLCLLAPGYPARRDAEYFCSWINPVSFPAPKRSDEILTADITRHVNAAKSARFEFGQSGW